MELYVAENGNDRNSGSEHEPLNSLPHAQRRVRECLARNAHEDVRVLIGPGCYRLDSTLVFGPEDGGGQARRVTWEARSPGEVSLSAGYPVTNWKQLTEEPDCLPAAVRGRTWLATLPEGCSVNTLYSEARCIPRARSRSLTPLNRQGKRSDTHFTFEPGAIPPLPDLDETEAVLIPARQWVMNMLPMQSLDTDKGIAHLAEPCTYVIAAPPCKPTGSIWIENSLATLAPGTWVFHRKTCTLYYCPKADAPEANLVAPLFTELVRVEGRLDGEEPDQAVRGLDFKGITFKHTRRYAWHGKTGLGIQHDWEMHDAPSCMVRFRGAIDCHVTNCRFEQGGSGGLRMDLVCRENSVRDCVFSELGGCGIVLCGYGPGLKYENRDNLVSGNYLHHLGRLYWHSPAVFVWQSGSNIISENYIHDMGYTAIVCSGRIIMDREGHRECSGTIRWDEVDALLGADVHLTPWHHGGITAWSRIEPLLHSRENRIEYNHIHDVMQVLGDGNGIYISGAGGGNLVRFNVVGPCPAPNMAEAIRCDNDQHQTIIHGNLVMKIGGHAVGICIKGVNRITNNIIALPTTRGPGQAMLSLEVGPLNGAVVKRNVLLLARPEHNFAKQTRIHGTGRRALLRDADTDWNLYWNAGDASAGPEFLRGMQDYGVDQHSLAVDPGFVAPESGEFRLREDSPLIELGFRALPLERMYQAQRWAAE